MDDFVVIYLVFWVSGFKNWVSVDIVDLVVVDGFFMDRDYCDGFFRWGL